MTVSSGGTGFVQSGGMVGGSIVSSGGTEFVLSGGTAIGATIGNGAGPNDEIYAFHPGGADVLFGDGSVKFLKATLNIVVQRSLITLNGSEVISADAF